MKYWHEKRGVPLHVRCDVCPTWDALSYAEKSTAPGAAEVQDYLQEHICAASSDAVDPEYVLSTGVSDTRVCMRSCRGITTHGNVADPVAMLVDAAESGCKDCVEFLVTVKGIHPLECRKDLKNLNAMKVAKAGAIIGWPGCSAVLELLQGYINRHGLLSKINEGDL